MNDVRSSKVRECDLGHLESVVLQLTHTVI